MYFPMLHGPPQTLPVLDAVQSAVEDLAALFSRLDSLAAPGGTNYPTDSH
jgi:hypothetical protein